MYFNLLINLGEGKIIYPNGDEFDGTFEDDERKKGILRKKNGRIYEGSFKNDERDGIAYWTKDGIRRETLWKNDELVKHSSRSRIFGGRAQCYRRLKNLRPSRVYQYRENEE